MENLGKVVAVDAIGVSTKGLALVKDRHGQENLINIRCWFPTSIYLALEQPVSEV